MIRIGQAQFNTSLVAKELEAAIKDDACMTEVHNTLLRFCAPYVPKQQGILQGSGIATPEYAEWNTPYAHYQYTGEVYGPNYPIMYGKQIVGWHSPLKKHPTGRELGIPGEWNGWQFGYTTPGTGHHWDQKMMRERGDKFIKQLEYFIIRNINKVFFGKVKLWWRRLWHK